MRLEVLADNKGAVIYVLNRPEIYIGSTESNDIVISSAEISKKHLKIIVTDDQKCFVIDQGSTNGSFINDQRLVPGKRELFPLFSSMRLGDRVLLTLLDKDKGELPELPLREQFVEEKKIVIAGEDKTRVISLKTLQKTKTEKVRKTRLKKLEKDLKKKKQVRNDKKILNQALMTAAVIVGLAFTVMKTVNMKRKKRGTIAGTMKETRIMIDDTIESVDESVADLHIPRALLLRATEISTHDDDVTCSLPEEIFFCKRMTRGSRKKNGALNINGQLVIYLEQNEWLAKAQVLVGTHKEINQKSTPSVPDASVESLTEEASVEKTRAEDEVSIEMLHRIGFLSYLKTYLWRPLPVEYQAMNLYLVFYSHVGSGREIESIMAVKGSVISQINVRYTEDLFRFKKYDPYKIIKKLDRFYRVY